MLAQASDRAGERRVGGGEAGAGQVAFGAQYGDQPPGRRWSSMASSSWAVTVSGAAGRVGRRR
jgi:hypothetical protein